MGKKRPQQIVVVVKTATCTPGDEAALKYIKSKVRNTKFVSTLLAPAPAKVNGVIYLGNPTKGLDPQYHKVAPNAWYVRIALDPFWPLRLWGPKTPTEPGKVVALKSTGKARLAEALRIVAYGDVPHGLTKVHDPHALIYPYVVERIESYELAQELLTRARSDIIRSCTLRLMPGYVKTTSLVDKIISFLACVSDYPMYNRGRLRRDPQIKRFWPRYKQGQNPR